MYQDLSIAAAQQAKGQELKLAEYLRKQAEGQFRLRDKIKHAVQTANGSKPISQPEQRRGSQRIPFFNAFLSLSLFKKPKLVEESPECERTTV